jgi:ATP-binding protein involved in chromosome partitioning
MADRPLTEGDVLAALARVIDPERLRDVVSLQMVRNLRVCDGNVAFDLAVTGPPTPQKQAVGEQCRRAVSALPGVQAVNVKVVGAMAPPPGAPGAQPSLIPGVRHVIAVGSGKGGVGKSTVAVNLAAALALDGERVGLLDADVYGPSIPTMMGTEDARPIPIDAETIGPPERHGLKLMSMGFLVPSTQAVIWRGPMVHRAITQFLTDIDWGQLDTLVIDLPPGTGDAQLTLTQTAPLSGAVIVTTPQDVSLIDARKGLEMFRQVRVPVLGIVENMSFFVGADGKRYEIFRHGGGQKLANEAGVPFLGAIPIDPQVAECGDQGDPIVHKYPDNAVAKAYLKLAETVSQELAKMGTPQDLPGLQL